MNTGWVYVVTNPAMPDMVKVGFTRRHPRTRAQELNNTGVPDAFVAEYAVLVEDPDGLERAVHDHLRWLGLGAGKEWFKCSKELAVATIDEIAADEIRRRYTAQDEAIRKRRLDERKVEEEKVRTREDVLRRFAEDRDRRREAQLKQELARREAASEKEISKHASVIATRRSQVAQQVKDRHLNVFAYDASDVRSWPVFLFSLLTLGILAHLLPPWGPELWLSLPLVATLAAFVARKLIVNSRRRSAKCRYFEAEKTRLLKMVDDILPHAAYNWYEVEFRGRTPRFLTPLPEQAMNELRVTGEVARPEPPTLRGLVHNSNRRWVITGVDLRVPQGYRPSSVRLPLCVLPGEDLGFAVRLIGPREPSNPHGPPSLAPHPVGEGHLLEVGGAFGYEVDDPAPEVLRWVRPASRDEVIIVPWASEKRFENEDAPMDWLLGG